MVDPKEVCADILKLGFRACTASLLPYNGSKYASDTKHLGFLQARNLPVKAVGAHSRANILLPTPE